MPLVDGDLAVDHLEARVQLGDLGSDKPFVLLQQSETILLVACTGPAEVGEPSDRGDRHTRLAQTVAEEEPVHVRLLVDPMTAVGARDRAQEDSFALEEPERMDAHPGRLGDRADREAACVWAMSQIIP